MAEAFAAGPDPNSTAPQLFGRDELVADVLSELGTPSNRLLLLLGPGGVGKSSIARVCVAERAIRDGQPAPFIELAAIHDERLMLPAIASSLEITSSGVDTLFDAIAAHLQTGPNLLVLDNLEQIAGAASVVHELLRAEPAVRVLATSRTRLNLPEERVIEVPSLPTPDVDRDLADLVDFRALPAIALFERQARLVLPDFEINTSNAGHVAEIVRRLDGIPMAIELIASRVRVLSLAEIATRLSELAPLTDHARSGAPERQQTISASIAWSYDLLPDSTKLALARLAVFPGRFDLAAAEAVAGAGIGDVEALLEHYLVRLIERGGTANRFDLPESVRQFGLHELKRMGEESAIRERHADWRCDLSRDLENAMFSPDPDRIVRRHFETVEDFNQAMAWSLEQGKIERAATLFKDLSPHWSSTPWELATIWWDQLEPRLRESTIDQELLARCLIEAASAYYGSGHLVESDRCFTRATAFARETGNVDLLALSLRGHCATLRGMTEHDRAGALFDEMRGLADLVNNPLSRYRLFIELGAQSLMISNDLDAARREFQEALDVARSAGARGQEGNALHFLGYVEAQRGSPDAARDAFKRSIQALNDGPETQRLASLHGLGRTELIANRPGDAYSAFRESLAGRMVRGELLQVRLILADLALVARSIGRPRLAAEWFGAASLDDHHLTARRFFADRWVDGLAATRQELGEEEFRRAFDRGRMIGLTETVEAVLAFAPVAPVDTGAGSTGASNLTSREIDVLRLVVSGASDRQIADALFISPLTATRHVKNILRKLGVNTRTAAAMAAVRLGILGPDS